MSDEKTSSTSSDPSGASSDKQGFISKMAPVTEQERQLSQHAKAEFDKGNYDACISTLGTFTFYFLLIWFINQGTLYNHALSIMRCLAS